MLATTKHFEPRYIEEAKDWGRERVITRIQIQLLPVQSSFPYYPYAVGEKLALSQVKETVRVQESLCQGTEGDGRQPKN